jgi:hypothetical protein
MATKGLTIPEKMSLLQHHGEVIASAFRGGRSPDRSNLIESAERALALIKSIPKIEFAIEE